MGSWIVGWYIVRGAGTIIYIGGGQPIKINVVVKGGGDQYVGGPPRF